MEKLEELFDCCIGNKSRSPRNIKGRNILSLNKILGHSDLKMTMRYAHMPPMVIPLSRLNTEKEIY